MKKNLKGCIDPIPADEARVLIDMGRESDLRAAGMTPDRLHKKSAPFAGAWRFAERTEVRMDLHATELCADRYLTLSVFAVNGEGGSFSILFDCDGKAANGYECTLSVARNGWNHYRIELPFLRAVGEPTGWDHVVSVSLDCVRGGQSNRADTVLYLDSFFGWKHFAPPVYSFLPELKGAAVFSRQGGYALVDRKKIASTPDGIAKPFEHEGQLWLPMAPVAAGIAHSAVVDTLALTLTFTYRRKKYAFSAAFDRMTVDGAEEPLGFFPKAVAGTLFFPLDFVKGFFHWRQVYLDPMGLIVLSNRKNVFESVRDAALVWELITDTAFVRPTSDRILEDLHRNFPNPGRGRLFASFDEWMQLRRLAKSDAALGAYVDALKASYGTRSERFAAPVVAPEADAAALWASADALIAFAVLYRVTGDKQYAERTAAEAEAMALVTDWRAGSNTLWGEVTLAMAVAYDWCHHVWSEGRKALLERAMLRNAMRPALDVYDGKGSAWRTGTAASAAVNAGMLAASLAMADIYPQTAYKLLDRIPRNLAPSFAALAPDGGHAESVEAWAVNARALGLAVAMLEKACGSDYGFASAPGFAATAYFPLYTETAAGAWNYHDAAATAVDTSILSYYARRSGDAVLAWMHRRELLTAKKAVRPFDILFYAPVDDAAAPHMPLDAVYRNAGLAIMRSDWGNEANVLGLHGGSNRVLGGDLDAGSILLEMGGERFFAETGREESLPALTRRRAAGQNTWCVDPAAEPAPDQNPDAVARLCEMRSAPTRAYAVVDMTSTSDALVRAKRGAMLTNGRRVAVIQDELTLAEPGEFVWTAWTRAEVKLNPSGRCATLTQNGKVLACRIAGVGSPARFALTEAEGSDWKCLSVRVPVKEKLRMAVVCRLLANGERAAEKVYDVVPMSKWAE